jgi:hypothetical protein
MLNTYLLETQRLLQNPPASSPLYNPTDLTAYINTARSQIALESAAIRVLATLSITGASNSYNFSAINVTGTSGVEGVQAIRMMSYNVTGGKTFVIPRPWEWFNRYLLCQVSLPAGPPQQWAQYAQGSLGSLFVSPTPDVSYTINLDAICYPIALASDSDPEALPYPWTDAVPFFAAYYAYLSSQREQDAVQMFAKYEFFAARARRFSTPDVLPNQYNQMGLSAVPQQAAPQGQAQGGG